MSQESNDRGMASNYQQNQGLRNALEEDEWLKRGFRVFCEEITKNVARLSEPRVKVQTQFKLISKYHVQI